MIRGTEEEKMENNYKSVSGRLDIGKCFNEALEIYQENMPTLFLATFLLLLISVFTLGILAGALTGGYHWMLVSALRRPDKRVVLGDLFRGFDRFWRLTGLFYLGTFMVAVAFCLLIFPGLLLGTLWMFAYLLVIDRGEGVFSSLGTSWRMVQRAGLWGNLLLYVVFLALVGGVSWLPVIGWLINFFLMPLACLLIASAYRQEFGGSSETPGSVPGDNR